MYQLLLFRLIFTVIWQCLLSSSLCHGERETSSHLHILLCSSNHGRTSLSVWFLPCTQNSGPFHHSSIFPFILPSTFSQSWHYTQYCSLNKENPSPSSQLLVHFSAPEISLYHLAVPSFSSLKHTQSNKQKTITKKHLSHDSNSILIIPQTFCSLSNKCTSSLLNTVLTGFLGFHLIWLLVSHRPHHSSTTCGVPLSFLGH